MRTVSTLTNNSLSYRLKQIDFSFLVPATLEGRSVPSTARQQPTDVVLIDLVSSISDEASSSLNNSPQLPASTTGATSLAAEATTNSTTDRDHTTDAQVGEDGALEAIVTGDSNDENEENNFPHQIRPLSSASNSSDSVRFADTRRRRRSSSNEEDEASPRAITSSTSPATRRKESAKKGGKLARRRIVSKVPFLILVLNQLIFFKKAGVKK